MAGAEIPDTTRERTVGFSSATIRDATIHRSIIDEHARVADIDLGDARVGAYSHLGNEVKSTKRDGGRPIAVESRQ